MRVLQAETLQVQDREHDLDQVYLALFQDIRSLYTQQINLD